MATGDITITIQDGGANTAITVPSANVRVEIGCLLTGISQTAVVNQIISATNPSTIANAFIAGKLCEAAGLVCASGGVVLAIGIPVVTHGTATAVVPTVTNGSAVVLTVDLDATNGAFDDYNVMLKCVTTGTIATSNVQFQISLDAGRTFGPVITLITPAATYTIPNTGITIDFTSAAMNAGDYWRFSTTAPLGDLTGITAAIAALKNSTYALSGWGGMHNVGVCSNSLAGSFQTLLGGSPDGTGGLASGYIYSRIIVDVVDSLNPTAWGGAGQTEAAWMTAIETAFATTNAKRVCAAAGSYNMPSAYANTAAGTPSYRRPLSWALDCREAIIPPQRHAGRVRDGSLGQIVINPSSDPTDGFVYHDERITPGLTTARFAAAKTRVRQQGYFIDQPNLMAPTGSQYTLLPYGNVIDIACSITFQSASEEIDDDLRVNPNGTLLAADRLALQNSINAALQSGMTAQNMISGQTVVVDPNANVEVTSNIPISVSILRNGYVLSETITIGFTDTSAAGG